MGDENQEDYAGEIDSLRAEVLDNQARIAELEATVESLLP
jgi:hypothetical protein